MDMLAILLTFTLWITTQATIPEEFGITNPVSTRVGGYYGCGFGGKDRIVDEDLGEINLNPEKYCRKECGRSTNLITCCKPYPIDLLGMQFTLYSRTHDGKTSVQSMNWRNRTSSAFTKGNNKKVLFIIHGFTSNIRLNGIAFMKKFREPYLDSGDYDVVTVEWYKGNLSPYYQALANIRVVGAAIGKAILNWNVAERSLLVGYSLGAQLIHEAASFVRKHGHLVAECHGLDPAGPGFNECDDISLDRQDCKLVKVIHTNANSPDVKIHSLSLRLGTYKKNGHCDYWINCGHNQPCLAPICEHETAVKVYMSHLKKQCSLDSHICHNCGRDPSCRHTVDVRSDSKFMNCTSTMNHNFYVPLKYTDTNCW